MDSRVSDYLCGHSWGIVKAVQGWECLKNPLAELTCSLSEICGDVGYLLHGLRRASQLWIS